ncbi:MAG: type II secretion system protein [Nitrospirota bacterium]
MFALFAIVLVGLSMMGANKQWTTMMQREREAELLFRGHQYRRAVASYVESVPGARQYPPSVEALLKDPRTSKRHLRTGYLDPITGGPFLAVQCPTLTDRFKGVVSSSNSPALKHDNFPADYEQFRSAGSYRGWVFQYEPQPAQPGQRAPALPPIPC